MTDKPIRDPRDRKRRQWKEYARILVEGGNNVVYGIDKETGHPILDESKSGERLKPLTEFKQDPWNIIRKNKAHKHMRQEAYDITHLRKRGKRKASKRLDRRSEYAPDGSYYVMYHWHLDSEGQPFKMYFTESYTFNSSSLENAVKWAYRKAALNARRYGYNDLHWRHLQSDTTIYIDHIQPTKEEPHG